MYDRYVQIVWVVLAVHTNIGVWFLCLGLLSSGETREELVWYWNGGKICGLVCQIVVSFRMEAIKIKSRKKLT